MEINDFIKNFANQFDDTALSVFAPATMYKELDEWSSLLALAVLNMIGKKYDVVLKISEIQQSITIQALFDLVQSKARL